MFALSDADLSRRVLGCGDGPASFNAEASADGVDVVSVDPIYAYPAEEIRARVEAVFDDMVGQTAANAADFTWGRGVDDLDDLVGKRRTAMELFLGDYEAGRAAGRYRPGQLPLLPFGDGAFDMAVCSHFLFLYGEHLSTRFHADAITELCRVAREVRIFPLLELGSLPSRHLDAVRTELDAAGITTSVEPVEYEFQRGGDKLLVASAGS